MDLCEGNPPVTPLSSQGAVTRSVDVFFDLRQTVKKKQLSSLLRHCNVLVKTLLHIIPSRSFLVRIRYEGLFGGMLVGKGNQSEYIYSWMAMILKQFQS